MAFDLGEGCRYHPAGRVIKLRVEDAVPVGIDLSATALAGPRLQAHECGADSRAKLADRHEQRAQRSETVSSTVAWPAARAHGEEKTICVARTRPRHLPGTCWRLRLRGGDRDVRARRLDRRAERNRVRTGSELPGGLARSRDARSAGAMAARRLPWNVRQYRHLVGDDRLIAVRIRRGGRVSSPLRTDHYGGAKTRHRLGRRNDLERCRRRNCGTPPLYSNSVLRGFPPASVVTRWLGAASDSSRVTRVQEDRRSVVVGCTSEEGGAKNERAHIPDGAWPKATHPLSVSVSSGGAVCRSAGPWPEPLR